MNFKNIAIRYDIVDDDLSLIFHQRMERNLLRYIQLIKGAIGKGCQVDESDGIEKLSESLKRIRSIRTFDELNVALRGEAIEIPKEIQLEVITSKVPLLSSVPVYLLSTKSIWYKIFGKGKVGLDCIGTVFEAFDENGKVRRIAFVFIDESDPLSPKEIVRTILHESVHLGQKNPSSDLDDLPFYNSLREGYTEWKSMQLYKQVFTEDSDKNFSSYPFEQNMVEVLLNYVDIDIIERCLYINGNLNDLIDALGEQYQSISDFCLVFSDMSIDLCQDILRDILNGRYTDSERFSSILIFLRIAIDNHVPDSSRDLIYRWISHDDMLYEWFTITDDDIEERIESDIRYRVKHPPRKKPSLSKERIESLLKKAIKDGKAEL